jgi:hypothetical protein
MAIQVTEKKKETKYPKGIDVLFQFSVFFFIFVGIAYFFTIYLNVKAEELKLEVERRIEEKKAEIPEKEELERVAQRYFHLVEDFKLIVDNNRVVSPFFFPFEEMIHPRVVISSLSVDSFSNSGIILGEGEDLVAVGQQFLALKNNENTSEVNLVNIDILSEEEVVRFSFSLNFNKDLFKFYTND